MQLAIDVFAVVTNPVFAADQMFLRRMQRMVTFFTLDTFRDVAVRAFFPHNEGFGFDNGRPRRDMVLGCLPDGFGFPFVGHF